MLQRTRGIRLGRLERVVRGLSHFVGDACLERVEFLLGGDPVFDQQGTRSGQRVADLLNRAFFFGAIGPLVVGHRVGVRSRAVRVNQGRALSLTGISDCFTCGAICFDHIGAVALQDV